MTLAKPPSITRAEWDWNGVVGTGQSLSVGTPPVTSVRQPYGNLKLSLGPEDPSAAGPGAPPWDARSPHLSMAPLIEPIRPLQTGFPSAYPGNVYGETPHSAMANEITRLAREASSRDHVTVHTVVGESGQGIVALEKQREGATPGPIGRAYAATLFEVEAIARLAATAGKTYGVAVVVMTHGETDCGSATYGDSLVRLRADYDAGIKALTGQRGSIPMYLSQQHAFPNGPDSAGQRPLANHAQWRLGVEAPGDFVCVGPKYQYCGHENGDGVHLSAGGYQCFGEKVAQVYHQRAVLGVDWQPLHPIAVRRAGRVVGVRFHVPVAPLVWESSFDAPRLAPWTKGRGFELRAPGEDLVIEAVAIAGDEVFVTAATDLPERGLLVGYALASQGVKMSTASNAVRWGQLRDSDPFCGRTTGTPNPNHCVSFELSVP